MTKKINCGPKRPLKELKAKTEIKKNDKNKIKK